MTASKTRQMMNHSLAKSFKILGNGDDLCLHMDPKQLVCSQKLEWTPFYPLQSALKVVV